MAGKDLELALRIKADLDQAQRELVDLQKTIEKTGTVAATTGQQLDAAATATTALEQRSRTATTAQAGLATSTRAATDATASAATVMARAGLSAGQYQQAMRMLPMQMTDVVTSVASGMPIWMVAIQQGGQIRDSFGGIGNAARAMLGAINPVTAAVAGVAAVGVGLVAAYESGASEQREFNEALILTGNYAGVTAGQLAAMAREMDNMPGVTQSGASETFKEVVASGEFAGEQIKLVATAAEQMQEATGRSVSETIAEFKRLAKEPVATLLKLNESQHFLTSAQLEQIRSLKDQGKEQEAATQAMRLYSDVIDERTKQVERNLGGIERAWRNIKQAAAETIDGLAGIGRPLDDTQQIDQLSQRIAYLRSTLGTGFEPLADTQGEITKLSGELDTLNAKQKAAADATKSTLDSAAETARQTAADSFVKGAEAQTQSLQKLSNVQKAHQIMQQKGITETSTLGQRMLVAAEAADKQKAATDAATEAERAAEAAQRKSKQETEAAARAAEQLVKQQLDYVKGLEKQAATLDMSGVQTREYELAEKGLTGTLQSRAKAALAVLNADEKRRQAEKNSTTNAGLQADYLRATGSETDAALLELRTKFATMRTEFEKTGNEAGLAWLDKLIPVSEAKIRVDDVKTQMDRILSEQQRQEQSVNVQQDAGLLNEMQARERILEIHQQTYQQLQQIRPVLEELAAQPGAVGEAAAAALAQLNAQGQQLLATTTLLQSTLRDGLTTGFTDAIKGLADGTMTLRDAVTALADGVTDALIDMAAQNLAQSAANGIMGLFGSGSTESAGLTTGAAAVTTSAGVLSAAGGTLITGAAAIQTAATSLATANGMSGVGAAGSAAGSSGSWLSSLFSSASVAAATGGHVTGPGTETSDSIPAWLSNDEFVTRAAVVTQPGALGFLHEFNARGMAALDAYALRVRHATGGLAGIPAPLAPAPLLGVSQLTSPAAEMSAQVSNILQLNLIDDPQRIASVMSSREGIEALTVVLSRNPQKFRQVLGV